MCHSAPCAGFVPTRMSNGLLAYLSEADIAQCVPLGRLGAASDMGGAALFLASAAGAWVTGQARRGVEGGEGAFVVVAEAGAAAATSCFPRPAPPPLAGAGGRRRAHWRGAARHVCGHACGRGRGAAPVGGRWAGLGCLPRGLLIDPTHHHSSPAHGPVPPSVTPCFPPGVPAGRWSAPLLHDAGGAERCANWRLLRISAAAPSRDPLADLCATAPSRD